MGFLLFDDLLKKLWSFMVFHVKVLILCGFDLDLDLV